MALVQAMEDRSGVTITANPDVENVRDGGDGGGRAPTVLTWPFSVRLPTFQTLKPRHFVGTDIKQQRTLLGMTQAGLATRLGIDRKTLRSWERGETIPGKRQLALLAECLGYNFPI